MNVRLKAFNAQAKTIVESSLSKTGLAPTDTSDLPEDFLMMQDKLKQLRDKAQLLYKQASSTSKANMRITFCWYLF